MVLDTEHDHHDPASQPLVANVASSLINKTREFLSINCITVLDGERKRPPREEGGWDGGLDGLAVQINKSGS